MSAKITLRYEGKDYVVVDKYSPDAVGADYMWTMGNYSCDDNRSIFIAKQCDPEFPQMGCGETIGLVKIEDA